MGNTTRIPCLWWSDSRLQSFANGFQVCEKIIEDFNDPEEEYDPENRYVRYRHGDYISVRDTPIIVPLDKLNLKWIDIQQHRELTAMEKVRQKLFKTKFETELTVRPEPNTIIIASYGMYDPSDYHYEVVEYSDRQWITELSFPIRPDRFCYIPVREFFSQKTVDMMDGYTVHEDVPNNIDVEKMTELLSNREFSMH